MVIVISVIQIFVFSGSSRKKHVIVVETEKEEVIKKEQQEEKEVEKHVSETDFLTVTENGMKFEDNSQDEGEIFTQDYFNNDDDDFEWKEEPLVEIHDESPDSEGIVMLYDFNILRARNTDQIFATN